MSSASRAVVVAAVIAVTLAMNAQENCPPPGEPVMHWAGTLSGCTDVNQLPCEVNESIVFSVTPSGGGLYPGCVTYFWDFGDGVTSTEQAPSHSFAFEASFFVLVGVRGGLEELFDGKTIAVTTVVPRVQSFSASATTVRRGRLVVLSWATTNATTVRIDPIGVSLPATTTSFSIFPTVTRTYTLTAFGGAAFSVSKPVTVVVTELRRLAVRH